MFLKKIWLSVLLLLAFAAISFAQSTTTLNWANLRTVMQNGYTDIQLGANITPASTAGAMFVNPAAAYTVTGNGYSFTNTFTTNPLTFFSVTTAGQTATLTGINFIGSTFNGSTRILINGATTYFQNNLVSSNTATTATGNIIRNQAVAALLDISNSTFTYNTANGNGAMGGVIYNASVMNIGYSSFKNNTTGAAANTTGSIGGAIYNLAGANATILSSIFDSNRALGTGSKGGAIYNAGTMTIDSSLFNANGLGQTAGVSGGAIYNEAGSTLDITGTNGASVFTGNVAAGVTARGGAIADYGIMTIDNATFSGNSVGTAANGGGLGGAIYVGSAGDLTITDSSFDLNKAQSNATLSHGGAIAVDGVLTITAINSDINFVGNTATGQGGAIRAGAYGTANIIADGANINFINNTAGTSGGAVQGVANSTLNLTANVGNIIFTGNYAGNYGGSANGLNIGSTANLTVNDGDIIFNDGIASSLSTPLLPVNLNIYGTNGNVVLNADMKGNKSAASPLGYNGTVNLYSGTIKIVDDTWFFNSPFVGNGGTLDRQNGSYGTLDITNFTLNSDVDTNIDVDLLAAKGSYFSGAIAGGVGKIMISNIKLANNVSGTPVDVPVADLAAAPSLDLKPGYVLNGAIYTYDVTYLQTATNGVLHFLAASFSPTSYIPQVTMQTGGYFNQLNAYAIWLDYLGVYNPNNDGCSSCSFWLRPYGWTEDVDFRDGIKVDNDQWGIYGGFDTRKLSLGKSVYTGFSIFAGYNNSGQNYQDVDIDQQSFTLGAAAGLYIGNFFSGLTVSGSKGSATAESYLGKEDLDLNTLGAAFKAGYNARLSSIFILQPAVTLSYTQVKLNDYTNAGGYAIEAQTLAPVGVEPALKLIASLDEKTYAQAGLSYLYNTNTKKSDVTAGGIELAQIYINNYLTGSVGITRSFSDSFSAGINLYARALDRTGVGATLDLRFMFGKVCPVTAKASNNENGQNEAAAGAAAAVGAAGAGAAKTTEAAGGANNNASNLVSKTGAEAAAGAGANNASNLVSGIGTGAEGAGAAAIDDRGPILFDFDKYDLKPEGKARLQRIASKLQDGDYQSITVEGHTDNVGTYEYNLALSQRRADAGRNYLIGLGLDANKIKTKAYSFTRPVATNKTSEGRALNRRLEIITQF